MHEPELWRPAFHFTAPRGWLNDPNGMVFQEGEYHLFFQHNPAGTEWGNMTWGHAVSRDLLEWQPLPHALEPDATGTMYSGSAVVDTDNTAGFGPGALVALYTAAGDQVQPPRPYTQCLAWSTDRGRTWQKHGPVLGEIAPKNRDPRVFWHGATARWIMALYVDEPRGAELVACVQFWGSGNLKEWTYLSSVEGFYECPEICELAVEGAPEEKRWVLFGADGQYVVGHFDGTRFTAEGGKRVGDWGANYYAGQTFSHAPDGRRILIAWMRGGRYPGMPFNQQMTFPCALTLRRTGGGWRLCKWPVRELASRYARVQRWAEVSVGPGEDPLTGLEGELWDVELEVESGTATEWGLEVRGHRVRYLPGEEGGTLECLGRLAPVASGKVRVLVDRTSLEVYADGGAVAMSSCFLPKAEQRRLGFYARGGRVRIKRLETRRLAAPPVRAID